MALLRLIRWNNLLIIFLTQLLVWWCVIMPAFGYSSSPGLLNGVNFLCLSLSTVLIAAAGYIINDYFDIKIDIINKPDKVVFEKIIPRRMGIILHSLFNVVGLLLALFIALQAHHPEWIFLQLGCTMLLWFYSTHFKRQFMTGNIVVALLSAFTIIAMLLYEPLMHYYIDKGYFIWTAKGIIPNPVWVLLVYAYFAFVLTWMREIVKDMEDHKGDAEEGCVTMPIKWGLLRSVRFVQMLATLAVIPLLTAAVKLCVERCWLLGIYAIAALVLPIVWWAIWLQGQATKQHYHQASKWIKIIMVLGIGSLIIYYFQVHA